MIKVAATTAVVTAAITGSVVDKGGAMVPSNAVLAINEALRRSNELRFTKHPKHGKNRNQKSLKVSRTVSTGTHRYHDWGFTSPDCTSVR